MPNQLQHETSPYLLQHANNPVHWQAWNEKAFEQAKANNQLVVVSIGYSACHWCHVMEHESFEDKEVAKVMNEHFVSIKVDREERPDVDQVYMDACLILTGRGGWPLNVICLPDGKPVYAGTYFRKEQWINLLEKLAQAWQNNAQVLMNQAERITNQAKSLDYLAVSDEQLLTIPFTEVVNDWLSIVDWKYGGDKGAPKFPMPSTLDFLLKAGHQLNNERATDFSLHTLTQMANGGIYDQLGGGFARYSVDEEWHVPHFEKMLYDNAQLLSLYAQAYQQSKEELFSQKANETADFLVREMQSPEGSFYSAYDADSEGVEGQFYVFTSEEIDKVVGKHAEIVKAYYDVSPQGNWEGTNVLRVVKSIAQLSQRFHLSESETMQIIAQAKKGLYNYREQRIKPALDDKQLTAWNGLTISAFCDAYKAFGDEHYKAIALKTAHFYVEQLQKQNGNLFRSFKDGKVTITAFLDDYSCLANAFISVYEITFEEQWLEQAKQLLDACFAQFYDEESGLFYYTPSNGEELILRKKEVNDNVIPSSNALAFTAIYRYAKLVGNTEWEELVVKTLSQLQHQFQSNARYHSYWLALALQVQLGSKEVAIVGEKAEDYRKQLQKNYLPNALFLGSATESNLEVLNGKYIQGETLIYVCENHSCQRPVSTVEEALLQLKPD